MGGRVVRELDRADRLVHIRPEALTSVRLGRVPALGPRRLAIDFGLIGSGAGVGAVEGLSSSGEAVTRTIDRGVGARELLPLFGDAGEEAPRLDEPAVALIEVGLPAVSDGVSVVGRVVTGVGDTVSLVGRAVAPLGDAVALVGECLLLREGRVSSTQTAGIVAGV